MEGTTAMGEKKKTSPAKKELSGMENFDALGTLVAELTTDAQKCFLNENRSAGIRLRKGLKLIKQQLTIIKQNSLEVK